MKIDNSIIAASIFNKHANSYQDKFMNVDFYKTSFELFCIAIPTQNAKILELACGPGNITSYLLAKRPDFRILGTDLAPKMIELAAINNPKAKFQLMDCRSINTIDKKYNGIMCGFCLPYLSKKEAIQLIHDASIIFHSNGILYISTMEDENIKSDYKTGSQGDVIYMNYHEATYLTIALKKNNFNIIDLQRIVYPSSEEEKTTDLIIIAQKI